MKKTLFAFLSLTLLLNSIFTYKALAANQYLTNLYRLSGGFEYSETTYVGDFMGYEELAVTNYVYVDGSLYDNWEINSYSPGYCNDSNSYTGDPLFTESTISARTNRDLLAYNSGVFTGGYTLPYSKASLSPLY